jgi:YegS/Rv2252/BmrU family lipid kinase
MMLIINPFSGRGISRIALGTIISRLCGGGYIVTSYFAGEFTPEELVCKYAKFHELVVCVGGDGTLSSVVSGLLKADVKIPVGYIPTGTANDIAATLALSKDPATAAQIIINGSPRLLDIGRFGERHFTYIAAFGAFTGVAYTTPQSAKRALGHFAYVLGGMAEMTAIKAQRTVVEYDGNVIEGDFIFGGVANSTSVAGLVKLDPERVDLADGLFEVILVKQPIVTADLLDILSGLVTQSYDGDNVQFLHASNVKFSFNEYVPWTVDGEDGGLHKEVEISNCHKAISIIV